MIATTCCFTGHRHLPAQDISCIRRRLDEAIEGMIALGVDTFISGGALGFDQLAASIVLAKRDEGRTIKLVFCLPCADQDARWREADRRLYRALIARADALFCPPGPYFPGCMRARNYDMVARSAHLICYLTREKSGAGQTVSYAQLSGLNIVRITT